MDENIYEPQKKQQSNSLKKWPGLVTKDTVPYNKTEEHDVYVKNRKPALHHDSPVEDSVLWQKQEGNLATPRHVYHSVPCWCNRKTVAMKLPLTRKNGQCAATLLWVYGVSFWVKKSLLNSY